MGGNIMKKFYTTIEGRTFLILDGTRAYYTTDPKETEGLEENHSLRYFHSGMFDVPVALPTIKELKAEKKARIDNFAYELAPWFFVNIDYLIEALTRFPEAKGYWNGVTKKGYNGKRYTEALCLKDNNDLLVGIICPIATTQEHVEAKRDTLAGIVPNSKAICKFADSIEWYEGYLYAVHAYTVIRIPCEKKFEHIGKKVGADFAGMFEYAKNDITVIEAKVDKTITRLIGKAELISIDSQGRKYIKAEKGEACIC
jgi:hypothetical protein